MRVIFHRNISKLETPIRPRAMFALYAAAAGLWLGLSVNCGGDGPLGSCGNEVVDDDGEQCDEGVNNKADDAAKAGDCTRSCVVKLAVCGDSIQEGEEPCDEGPGGGKGCTADCELNPGCGNGQKEEPEGCDDATLNTPSKDAVAGQCTDQCKLASCGDDEINRDESCDNGLGNVALSIAQPGDCLEGLCYEAVCADVIGPKCTGCAPDGVCDQNESVANCSEDCKCGNKLIDAGEECDDGADNNASNKCTLDCNDAVCGDTFIWVGMEECDDGPGNNDTGKACNADCIINICGDGDLAPDEVCDDGNTISGDGCDDICQCFSECGDGIVKCDEECDDNNQVEHDTCSNDCRLPRWVFVTNDTFRGNLGGTAGADMKCQTAAMGKLEGTFMAWLADGTAPAPDERFNSKSFTGWYLLPDMTPVAKGWADLTSLNVDEKSYLTNAISITETKSPVGNGIAWTNTNPDGTLQTKDTNCSNWSNMTEADTGMAGQAEVDVVDKLWTLDGAYQCKSSNRLYCFQVTD